MSFALTMDRSATVAVDEVVTKAVSRAAALLGITNTTLAHILGVSEATASRLRAGHYTVQLGTKQYEFSLLLIRLFRGLDAIMGGEKASLQSWQSGSSSTSRAIRRRIWAPSTATPSPTGPVHS